MYNKFFLFFFFFSFLFAKPEKLIKLIDLLDDDTYIPIRQGQIFIIEIEGNPSEGKVWTVYEPKLLISRNLIKPLNLDNSNSTTFYHSKTDSDFSNGFYHFKFKSSKKNTGYEEITFIYKFNQKTIQKTIHIHIVSQPKTEL